MERHPFDGAGRVSSAELEAATVHAWLPPLIDKAGHLVQAQAREERRPAAPRTQEQQLAAGFEEGLAKGRLEGVAEGRREGLQQGQQEGHEKGMQQGLQQGLQQAQKQVDARMAEVDEVLKSLTHAMNDQDYMLEQALLNLVVAVARTVVDRELQIDTSHILYVVRKALAALPPSRDNVRIFVHPADVALLREAQERAGDAWRVLPDDSVAKGGCRVETEQSLVDYTVEHRFAAMVEQMLSGELGNEKQESFEAAPEPVVKPINPRTASVAQAPVEEEFSADEEPGLLEQVEYLRQGVSVPPAPLLRSGI